MGNEKLKAAFHYDSYYDENKRTETSSNIRVDYVNLATLTLDEKKALKKIFNDYLTNNRSDDIVEVATNIKEMFKCLDGHEYRLGILIEKEEIIQEVEYLNGLIDSYCFSIKEWDDKLLVQGTYKGTNIQYKKNGQYIHSYEDIVHINNELSIIFNTILKLHALEEKALHKTKKLK